jgi:tetratricopeptide (TPR) repeat protein
MTRHNIPRWFSEGISVYEEALARPGWGDDLNAHILKAYKEGKLLTVSELNSGMMRPKFPEQIALSYYQASLVCQLIVEKFGFGKIREALELFAQNLPQEEVFRRSLGWDSATLDAEYSRFVEARLKDTARNMDFKRVADGGHLPEEKGALTSILEKNPDDFFANLKLGTLLRQEKANSVAEPYLKKAEKLFPEFVEPGNPYQLLGEIYTEEKRADEALNQWLAWARYDESATLPLNRAAEIYRDRKDWKNVTKMLELSVYIHPYDPAVHTQLGEAAMEAKDWSTAVASYRVLVGLESSDPAGAQFNLARALLASGKKQEAKRATLRALEIAPSYEKAQQLLLKLSEGAP